MAINDGLRYVFREHLERHGPSSPDALLFTGRTGQPLRTSSVYRYVWKPALVWRWPRGVTPHPLRRSVGSRTLGTPILDVAAYLGHSRTQVTLRTSPAHWTSAGRYGQETLWRT